jgi:hypothetical protein
MDLYALRRDDEARLDGHEFDLEDLADWLPSGNIRVAKDDVGYCLSAAVIDNPPEGKTFYEAAQDLLPIVNGIGSLKSAKFRPVKLDGRYQDGKKRHTVIGAGTIEVRSRAHAVGTVTGPDGKVKEERNRLHLIREAPSALTLLGQRPGPEWTRPCFKPWVRRDRAAGQFRPAC